VSVQCFLGDSTANPQQVLGPRLRFSQPICNGHTQQRVRVYSNRRLFEYRARNGKVFATNIFLDTDAQRALFSRPRV
jgi:hypothetical protein